MTRPFVDRPIADRSAADRAAIEAAAHWGLSEPALLRVGMNAIYLTSDASDDLVLRVSAPSAPAEAALELSMFLSEQGLRVPQPRRLSAVVAGDLAVTCWERIESTGDSTDWAAVGEMVRTVHGLDRAHLPADYPVGSPTSFAWWDFDVLLGEVGDDIDDTARDGLGASIERHRGWGQFDDDARLPRRRASRAT